MNQSVECAYLEQHALPDEPDLIARGMAWEEAVKVCRESCEQAGFDWNEVTPTALNVLQRTANNAHKLGFKLALSRVASAQQVEPDRTGMRYYRNDACKAESAKSPDCICWTPATSQQVEGEAVDGVMKLARQYAEDFASQRIPTGELYKAVAGERTLAAWLALKAGVERLATTPTSAALPAGYKLVPVEPTPEMLDAGRNQIDFDRTGQNTYYLEHPTHLEVFDKDGAIVPGAVGGSTIKQDMQDAWAAMLAAAPTQPAGEQGWLPIETAPKDGALVLLWGKYWNGRDVFRRPLAGRWDANSNEWFIPGEFRFKVRPTHWQPHPTPPAGEQG